MGRQILLARPCLDDELPGREVASCLHGFTHPHRKVIGSSQAVRRDRAEFCQITTLKIAPAGEVEGFAETWGTVAGLKAGCGIPHRHLNAQSTNSEKPRGHADCHREGRIHYPAASPPTWLFEPSENLVIIGMIPGLAAQAAWTRVEGTNRNNVLCRTPLPGTAFSTDSSHKKSNSVGTSNPPQSLPTSKTFYAVSGRKVGIDTPRIGRHSPRT